MNESRPRVVIAGGGVGGLEALLALRALVDDRARIEVLAPEAQFTYRQFAVAEPFSMGEVSSFELAELVGNAGGTLRKDALRSVDARRQVVHTNAGAEVPYDFLVLAVGARFQAALPGATTYRGPVSNADVHRAVLALHRGESDGLAFAVPAAVYWALPAYELAILAASHLADIGTQKPAVHLVTGEQHPLGVFGREVSDEVKRVLDTAGVVLHAGTPPARVSGHVLKLVDGAAVAADQTFALPALEVMAIPGVAQGPHGFIDTDSRMRVTGTEGVFAVGDASWFPIKQGGLAAEQADVAAACIATAIDPEIESQPFRPRLRAALLTGDGPLYMRAGLGIEGGVTSRTPLWWPPGKVAGKYLTPFVAERASGSNQPPPPMLDLEPGTEGDELDHDAAVDVALYAAEGDARQGDFKGALRWLGVAERLDLTLPAEYALRREEWRRQVR
jgi:sulfide:quinone oxidoreductase